MLITRNGIAPNIDPTARVAASAVIVGKVRLGRRCYIDHGVIIESAGPPIEIADSTIIFAGSVIRSVGGRNRPAFAIDIGERALIAPHCTLTGCSIWSGCYIATGAILLQGAQVGPATRVGVGAIVHAGTHIPAGQRIGMRHVAVPEDDGYLATADVELARRTLGSERFFESTFALSNSDQAGLHEDILDRLLEEVHDWSDVLQRGTEEP